MWWAVAVGRRWFRFGSFGFVETGKALAATVTVCDCLRFAVRGLQWMEIGRTGTIVDSAMCRFAGLFCFQVEWSMVDTDGS